MKENQLKAILKLNQNLIIWHIWRRVFIIISDDIIGAKYHVEGLESLSILFHVIIQIRDVFQNLLKSLRSLSQHY